MAATASVKSTALPLCALAHLVSYSPYLVSPGACEVAAKEGCGCVLPMAEIPLVVLGASNVGKSSLTIHFVSGTFVDKYDATIEDMYRRPVDIDDERAVLAIVDTAGTESFRSMRDRYLQHGQGFVLVYSITDTETFQRVREIYAQIRRVKGPDAFIPCVLVGNKIDQDAYRAVSAERGRQLASEMQCPFLEVTAKDRQMTAFVFENLVRTIRSGAAPPAVQARSPRRQSATPAAAAAAHSAAGEEQEIDYHVGMGQPKRRKKSNKCCVQ